VVFVHTTFIFWGHDKKKVRSLLKKAVVHPSHIAQFLRAYLTTNAIIMSKPSRYSNRVPTTSTTTTAAGATMSTYANSIMVEKPLSYEGPCHRCNKLGHQAKDCSKPRICGKCGQKGHVERNCDTDNNYSNNNNNAHHQKKKQQKYRSVCKRCGQKGGHSSSRCPNVSRCKICTENHETRECPRNLGGTVSKKRREIEEQQSFVEQKRRAVMMEEVGGGRRGDEETGGDDGAEKRRKGLARKKVKLVRVQKMKRDEDDCAKPPSSSAFEQAKEGNKCVPLVDYASSSDE
jgi:hypothetical protein